MSYSILSGEHISYCNTNYKLTMMLTNETHTVIRSAGKLLFIPSHIDGCYIDYIVIHSILTMTLYIRTYIHTCI